MKRLSLTTFYVLICFVSMLFLTSCEKEQIATKTRMEGVWTVSHVYTSAGLDIVNRFNFPITAYHLSSDNTVISTAAPVTMYLVYGDNKYTEIASTIDQVFNYAGLDFSGGEFFVAGGVVDRFTLEMKLEGLPGQKTLTFLLNMLGIAQNYLDVVIYHKFMDVGVSFENNNNTMIWTFDDKTTAVYNTKDNNGNYILWGGWPVNNFSRCQIVLEKQVKDLNQVVQEAI
ncbi:MAG: hypothetical protein WCH34_07695 [Bacteroidota bacterium]